MGDGITLRWTEAEGTTLRYVYDVDLVDRIFTDEALDAWHTALCADPSLAIIIADGGEVIEEYYDLEQNDMGEVAADAETCGADRRRAQPGREETGGRDLRLVAQVEGGVTRRVPCGSSRPLTEAASPDPPRGLRLLLRPAGPITGAGSRQAAGPERA